MQLPFDQILGKNNPLKLPDVAAVEAVRPGRAFGDGRENQWKQGSDSQSSDTFFICFSH